MKTLNDFDFNNKKVLLRCDLNVPLKQGNILDDFRIKSAIPTINYLLQRNAKVIIITHLGDPQGKQENLKLDPIKNKLEEILKTPVLKVNNCIGELVEKVISRMEKSSVLLLENIRFYTEEEQGDKNFAKKLAKLGDIYINDAFGVSHRNHTSIALLPKYLPSGAGLLLEKEIKNLSKVLNEPLKPMVTIIGGIKISTKIKIIKKFLEISDYVLLGGGIANTILTVKGILNHRPKIKKELLKKIDKLDLTSSKLCIPVDGIISLKEVEKEFLFDGKAPVHKAGIGTTKENESVYDIGPDTIKIFKKIIKQAKMIIWNGPLGFFESKNFKKGTQEIIQEIANNKKAFKVVGGGETISAINSLGLLNEFNHISTGGGAMLEFLSGEKLPGIEALEK